MERNARGNEMITIAIANQKGGVGKTTTAVTLATGLARTGHHTLLVDTDAQGQVAVYLGLDEGDGLFDLLIAGKPLCDCIVYSQGTLAILRSSTNTTVAKTVLNAQRAPVDILTRALRPARLLADFCIIDTAPSVDPLSLATLYAADFVLVPLLCETLSLDGLIGITDTIADLRHTHRANTRLLGVLPTKYRKSTLEHYANLSALIQGYGPRVYPPIPLATAIAESTSYQLPLWDYAPAHPATKAYATVLARLLEDVKT